MIVLFVRSCVCPQGVIVVSVKWFWDREAISITVMMTFSAMMYNCVCLILTQRELKSEMHFNGNLSGIGKV